MKSSAPPVAVLALIFLCALPWLAGVACGASMVSMLNEIPFGENEGGLLFPGATVTGLLCLENRTQATVQVDFQATIPAHLIPKSSDDRITLIREEDRWILRTSFTLRVEGQRWFSTVRLVAPENAPSGEYVVRCVARVHAGKGVEVLDGESRLRVVAQEELVQWFEAGEALVPSNENGEPDERRQRNSILIRGEEKSSWQGLVPERKKSGNYESEPTAFAMTPITNMSGENAVLLVRLDFLDPVTRRCLPGFGIPYASDHGDALGEECAYVIVKIGAKSTEKVVLPIYTDPDVVKPGESIAAIGVCLFGTDAEVARRELPVMLIGNRWVPAATTLLALATALAGLAFFVCRRKRFFDMRSRELILIALFGTVTFAVVNIPGTLLLHVAHVILGPLSFLLTGFFYEILLYLLLVSLVVLIPRMGVITLVYAVRFLLSSFVLGEFTPVSFIHCGTGAVCLETAMWCVGLTRASRGEVPGRTRIVAAAVILGLTDVYLSFVFFNLSMFFYRLYYATWYLTAYLIINGFVFTAIAVPFGFKLGQRLKVTTIG